MENKNSALPLILLLILAVIWGTSYILIKKGLVVFSPGEVAGLRITMAGLILLPVALVKWKEMRIKHIHQLAASGMMAVFLPAFLFSTAQKHIDSSLAGILNTLSPIWTVIIGALVFKVSFKRTAVIGVLVGLAGTAMLMISRSGGSISFNLYGLLIVLACAFYGSNLNYIKFKITDLSSLAITSISVVLIAPLGALYLFGFTDFMTKMNSDPAAWRAFGFITLLAFMSTAVANGIFNKLVKMTTPLFASTVTYFIPIVSVAWGMLDGEQLHFITFIGLIAILGGVYLANRKWE